jgi:hypothetical protein
MEEIKLNIESENITRKLKSNWTISMDSPKIPEANWQPFFGNNHEKISTPNILCGGSVSFWRHIGKPLSQEVWKDLVHRLCINGLCIYRPNDMQWTIGWHQGHCIIDLDENDNIGDIHFSPYWQTRNEKTTTPDPS